MLTLSLTSWARALTISYITMYDFYNAFVSFFFLVLVDHGNGDLRPVDKR